MKADQLLDPAVSPVAQAIARVAVSQGVVVTELRKDLAVRAELTRLAGESVVTDVEWVQVERLLLDAMRQRANANSRTAGGVCSRCGQPVRWARTMQGKTMPLDPLPNARGNVEIRRDGSRVVAVVHGNHEVPLPSTAYRAHFSTCPHASTGQRPRPVAGSNPVCVVCRKPMDKKLHSLGERSHPTCGEAG